MADSEVRQKFEAWYGAQPRCLGFPKCDGDLVGLQHSNGCPLAEIDDSGGCSTMTTPFDCYLAGMRAGEIAMREKAAERIHHAFCRMIDRMQNICDCDEMAESIRALAISGAEESKREGMICRNKR